jgi:S1-C subfamily serine protease
MPSYEEYGFPGRPRRYRESPAPLALILFLVLLLVAAGLAIGYFVFRGSSKPTQDPDAQLREVTPRGDRDALEKERIRVFKEVSPGVVNVDTLRIQRTGYQGQTERQQGTGSGFVWDKVGRIVTNFHVIQDTLQVDGSGAVSIRPSARIRITMADRTPVEEVSLVGVAPDHDLAVLKISLAEDKLHPLKVGSSSDLDVGQTVYAIGNPFGQSLTFTHGIVSALDREINSITDRPITGAIQTDASLNPGNSGGPLLDREGRLIGVNTAITSPSGGNVGIGYAIPVDTVNQVVTDMIRNGRPTRPSMGVSLLRERDTRSLGVAKGVMIAEVRANSPAAKAGLLGFRADPGNGRQLRGDVIVAVNGETVNGVADFERHMARMKVQQIVTLTILRGEKSRDVEVTLEGI